MAGCAKQDDDVPELLTGLRVALSLGVQVCRGLSSPPQHSDETDTLGRLGATMTVTADPVSSAPWLL